MKTKYTKKQLLEAITYWKGQLRKLNEGGVDIDDESYIITQDEMPVEAELISTYANEYDLEEEARKDQIDGVETYVFSNENLANDIAIQLGDVLGGGGGYAVVPV